MKTCKPIATPCEGKILDHYERAGKTFLVVEYREGKRTRQMHLELDRKLLVEFSGTENATATATENRMN